MEQDALDARRASFLSVGEEYERARPGYPLAAIEWAVGSDPSFVVDLGCGPGKLTTQLARLGHRVVGIDPSVRMLRTVAANNLAATCGTAEAIPLKDGCADVITAAQAFHWFEHERAVPEMRRVLRRGGRVGLLWNLRDESVDWVRALSEIIGSEDAMAITIGEPNEFETRVRAQLELSFYEVEYRVFPHAQELTAKALVDLVRSRSYVQILPEKQQSEVLSAVGALCEKHPQLRDRGVFDLPYQTQVFRAAATYRNDPGPG